MRKVIAGALLFLVACGASSESGVELFLTTCSNVGHVEAVGTRWELGQIAPPEWEGRESILGDVVAETDDVAVFTSRASKDEPSFSVRVTTQGQLDVCRDW